MVPELRFKEFDGVWEIFKLVDVTEKIQDGTHFSPNINEVKDYKYITSKNIRQGYLDLNSVDYISEKEHRKIYKRCDVIYGDVLLTKDGSNTGNACLNNLKEEFSLLSSVAFLRANKSEATNEYIYQLISSTKGKREIQKSISGQAITRITLTKLRNYKFAYPSLPEQKKIATFLSTIDKKIQQLTCKKELLETYKKGLMQQLFSGELRFRDEEGKEYPAWEIKKLGSLVEIRSGYSPSKYDFVEGGAYPFLKVEELNNSTKYQQNSRFYTNNGKGLIERDSVIFPKRGAAILGNKVRILIKEAFIDSNLMTIKPINDELYHEFLYYKIFAAKLYKIADTSTIPQINNKHIEPHKMLIPSYSEQRKIANCLSSIDKKIDATTNQITKTQTFKKGLLQKMFV